MPLRSPYGSDVELLSADRDRGRAILRRADGLLLRDVPIAQVRASGGAPELERAIEQARFRTGRRYAM